MREASTALFIALKDVIGSTRMWVPTAEYANTKWSLTEKFKYALDEKGIEIPFNQLTVNINK